MCWHFIKSWITKHLNLLLFQNLYHFCYAKELGREPPKLMIYYKNHLSCDYIPESLGPCPRKQLPATAFGIRYCHKHKVQTEHWLTLYNLTSLHLFYFFVQDHHMCMYVQSINVLCNCSVAIICFQVCVGLYKTCWKACLYAFMAATILTVD